MAEPSCPPPATGMVRVLLQLEGLFLLVACLVGYARLEGNWIVFACGFFAGDLFSVAYVGGNWLGASVYNLSHTLVGPLIVLAIYAALPSSPVGVAYAGLIWMAHIGWERSLGYGLRYPNGFLATSITVDQDPTTYFSKPQEANETPVVSYSTFQPSV
ncbi:hypothetical protein SPRG_19208 [Saprolegnia parasitica CBS 223.65]|uniref:Uncharacterized protein n=1 Tax=Saprolegnia parasitica (strain CBS 223.65) TaxID=695850 RepID=A0A067CSS8_SAPPC|nr:hypothetical protein SPRG_19208 [Saprolegnia parasitica CBS 223.65]KDO33578.1 hypothetical protein SPRG_19208 [Saprolegnia parasitica CBS 223.65]|eukprot:XP_012195631.1 hypothetical protein SPRG_19208 [Saprolegnia parasitica CBS 223.65]